MNLFGGPEIEIMRLQRLGEPPRDPSADETWWEADVSSEGIGPYTILLWVTQTDEMKIRGDVDGWVREELQRQAGLFAGDPSVLHARSPIQLHPV